jgi:IS5 family transposase
VTGISFIDSTRIAVCHPKRIKRNKVFADVAKLGKSTMGWFFGFKLHLIVNDQGEILALCITPGNVDDRQPVPGMTKELFGKLFGDKGYISQALFEELYAKGLQLITHIRKNMKNRLLPLAEKLLLRKRSLIETINDQLKNISQACPERSRRIEHTRHRSVSNFMVNLLAGLVAYTHQEKKPALNLSEFGVETDQLPVLL